MIRKRFSHYNSICSLGAVPPLPAEYDLITWVVRIFSGGTNEQFVEPGSIRAQIFKVFWNHPVVRFRIHVDGDSDLFHVTHANNPTISPLLLDNHRKENGGQHDPDAAEDQTSDGSTTARNSATRLINLAQRDDSKSHCQDRTNHRQNAGDPENAENQARGSQAGCRERRSGWRNA